MIVGRDELLNEVQDRVLTTRMVTLTGPGGVGKTALAQRIAWNLQRADGALQDLVVRWVELDSIGNAAVGQGGPAPERSTGVDDDEAAEIDKAVAAALGIYDFGQRSLDEVDHALRRYFARARDRTVLVLDNCEHIVSDAAECAQMLLDATEKYPEKLRILCTSREALASSPEHVVNVSPLHYPEDDKDISKRGTWPAIEMFRQCMEQYGNPLPEDPDPEMVQTVAHIVRDAAGLPLAIQIAASLGRQASLAEIVAWTSMPSPVRRRRSGRDYADLGAHAGVVPEGLRRAFAASMRAADWSDKLDILLQRLAVVFDGSFDGEAAAAICADLDEDANPGPSRDRTSLAAGGIRGGDVPDLLSALVDKSLVAVDTSTTPARFHLLRPVRRFGAERLYQRNGDEEGWLREHHVRYFYDRAILLTEGWMSPDELDLVRYAQQESHNFRAAVAYACSRQDLAPMAVGIVTSRAQARLFHRAGDLPEGKREHVRAAEAAKDIDGIGSIVTGLSTTAIWYALCQGELEEARGSLRRILAEFPSEDERDYPAVVCMILAIYLLWVDKDPHCIELFQSAAERNVQESTAVLDGRYRFPDELDDLIHVMSRQGMTYGVMIMSFFAAMAAAFLGTEVQARSLSQDFMDWSERCGAPTLIAWSQMIRAIALMCHSGDDSDLDRASQLADQTVVDMIETGEAWGTVWAKHLVICVRAERLRRTVQTMSTATEQDRQEALRLAMFCGAARKLREISNVKLPGMTVLADRYQAAMELTREVAGDCAWEEAESAAHALEDDHAMRFGTPLDTVEMPVKLQPIPKALRDAWDSLGPREQTVTYYVAAGRSGAAIAAHLALSEKTVDEYAKRAKKKFGIDGHRGQFTELQPVIARLWAEGRPEDSSSGMDEGASAPAAKPRASRQSR